LNSVVDQLLSEGVIDSQMANSLTQKIANARNSADKDKICAGVNQLGAFKSQIEAQRGKKISDEAATLLINYTGNVIAGLLGQLSPGDSC
jgi:hypothetical protein